MRSIDAVCAILSNSLPTLTKNAADDKRDIGGPLAEAPHEVRKPFTAEWDVHPNTVAGGHERRLKIAPNAVQHLKFELVGRDPATVRELWWQVDTQGEFDLTRTPFWSRVAQTGFVSGSSSHADRLATIRAVHAATGLIVDPHTADGVKVAREHLRAGVPMVCLETA